MGLARVRLAPHERHRTHPRLDRPRTRRSPSPSTSARVYRERTARSGEYFERASGVMPGGVPSQFQKNDPWPVYIERGSRARKVVGRRRQRVPGLPQRLRRHVRRPREPGDRRRRQGADGRRARTSPRRPRARSSVAEELRRRWGLPQWRFTNSGTESTMDAIHLARGSTGRELIVKIEGTYHGHHDAVMVSVKPPADLMGLRERPDVDRLRPRLPRQHAGADARRAVQRRRRRWRRCSRSSAARWPA